MLWRVKALVRQSASQGGCWLKIPLASSDHFHIPSVQTSPSIVADKLSLDFVPMWALFAFVERMDGRNLARGAGASSEASKWSAVEGDGRNSVSRQIPPSEEKSHFRSIERPAKRMSPATNCSEEERAARSNRTVCTSQPVGGTLKSKSNRVSSGKVPNII